jgi:hypothetical protein
MSGVDSPPQPQPVPPPLQQQVVGEPTQALTHYVAWIARGDTAGEILLVNSEDDVHLLNALLEPVREAGWMFVSVSNWRSDRFQAIRTVVHNDGTGKLHINGQTVPSSATVLARRTANLDAYRKGSQDAITTLHIEGFQFNVLLIARVTRPGWVRRAAIAAVCLVPPCWLCWCPVGEPASLTIARREYEVSRLRIAKKRERALDGGGPAKAVS